MEEWRLVHKYMHTIKGHHTSYTNGLHILSYSVRGIEGI